MRVVSNKVGGRGGGGGGGGETGLTSSSVAKQAVEFSKILASL